VSSQKEALGAMYLDDDPSDIAEILFGDARDERLERMLIRDFCGS